MLVAARSIGLSVPHFWDAAERAWLEACAAAVTSNADVRGGAHRPDRRVCYPRSWRINSLFISPLIRLVRFAPNVQARQPTRLPSGCAFRPVQRVQPVSGGPVPVHAAGAAR